MHFIAYKAAQRTGVSDVAQTEHELDVRDLLCPLPVLKARKRLSAMKPGEILKVMATDPAARIDMPHYCNESGHRFIGESQEGNVWIFRIARKENADAE